MLNQSTAEALLQLFDKGTLREPAGLTTMYGRPVVVNRSLHAAHGKNPLRFGNFYDLGSPMLPFPLFMLNLMHYTYLESLWHWDKDAVDELNSLPWGDK